ncbi:MAG: hypothetical protein ACRDYW_07840 [Acidimicrobiales bacterium]|jgi:hypothetical protein
MSLLWAVPPVAVAAAVVLLLTQLRDIEAATADLATQLRRLDEVRVAVARVRAESAGTRARVHDLRSR